MRSTRKSIASAVRGAALITALFLGACATDNAVPSQAEFRITAAEAKTHACPQSVLEVGASAADCACAEKTLFTLGQDGAALAQLEAGTTEVAGSNVLTGIKPRRVTAIEILRLEAFEMCGFFEDGHAVGAGL